MKAPDQFSIYILAGGKSSRMGKDKGLCLLNGKPMIEYVIGQVTPISDSVFIITANEDYRIFNKELILDVFKDKGPAGGIDTALQHAKTDFIFVVACDMPFIDFNSIIKLFNHLKNHDIAIIKNGSQIESLFGFYNKSIAPKWRDLLKNHNLKVSDYYQYFDTNFVDSVSFLSQNEKLFYNTNTPEELNKALQWKRK